MLILDVGTTEKEDTLPPYENPLHIFCFIMCLTDDFLFFFRTDVLLYTEDSAKQSWECVLIILSYHDLKEDKTINDKFVIFHVGSIICGKLKRKVKKNKDVNNL